MNYGAELQAYATVRVLQEMGHQVEMIDIRLSDCHKSNTIGRIGRVLSSFGPAYRKFDSFWKHYIPVTKRYYSMDSIQADPPQGDVYLVGSDQVWNPDLTGDFAKLFFLNFGGDQVRRVSYASSFGTTKWEGGELTEEVSYLLQRFSHISCREQSGVKILHTFGIESRVVLDPTLLLEEYSALTGSLYSKNTLVYYPLSDDPELANYASALSKQLGLELINNNRTSTLFGHFTWDRVGIEEWVRNIAESAFVITRSFHGLVFCIVYKKPFAIIANKNNRGSRIINLLEQLNLKNRYFDSIQECTEARPWNQSIDYEAVYSKLKLLRIESINFLSGALK